MKSRPIHLHKYLWLVLGLAVAASAIVLVSLVFKSAPGPATTSLTLGSGTSTSVVYNLETVRTPEAQAQGLSGRTGLARTGGMLFAYDHAEQRCMWMKDMKFNIDIIWFDANHHISSIVSDLSPSTYPRPYCADAKYVVELPTGTAKTYDMKLGQVIKF